MERKRILIAAGAAILILAIGAAAVLLYKWRNKPEEVPVEEPEIIIMEEVVEEEPVINPIDFDYWQGINEHIYAWISIEDTNIGYPILQHPTDNAYYLDHTLHCKSGLPGSIYTENRNAKDFKDFNTLIYGHNMKDGSMFKHLHKFEDKEFFDTHETVMIYTETEILTYRVYAAVVYTNEHLLAKYDNEVIEDRQAFIQSLQDINSPIKLFREGMSVDEESELITLSTCTGNTNTRFLVIAEKIASETVTVD